MTMFSFLVTSILALSHGYDLSNLTSVISTDVIYNTFYFNWEAIYCNDPLPPDGYSAINRTFFYNESSILPSNCFSQVVTLRNGTTTLVVNMSYPTVFNSGFYDCCVNYKNQNGSAYKELCYRTTMYIIERFDIDLNGQNKTEISMRRDNILKLVRNPWNTNITDVSCLFNGTTLPENVQTMVKKDNLTEFSIPQQLIIYDTDNSNFGEYNCNITYGNGTTVDVVFTLFEAETRWYPWLSGTITSSPNTTDKNKAFSISFNIFVLFFAFFISLFT